MEKSQIRISHEEGRRLNRRQELSLQGTKGPVWGLNKVVNGTIKKKEKPRQMGEAKRTRPGNQMTREQEECSKKKVKNSAQGAA